MQTLKILALLVLLLTGAAALKSLRPRPQPAPAPVATAAPHPMCTPRYFRETLRSLASTRGQPTTYEQLQQPLRGGPELPGGRPRALRPGQSLDTPHLHLTVGVQRLRSGPEGGPGFATDHLILTVRNRSAAHLLYRVSTSLPMAEAARCGDKVDLPHNALVLLPHQTLRRSECLHHDDARVLISAVEVYEIAPLSHHYLSKLQPEEGAPFDLRVARAHTARDSTPCLLPPWRGRAAPAGDWRALTDYFARHDCDDYALPATYAPLQQPVPLPICAAGATPPGWVTPPG